MEAISSYILGLFLLIIFILTILSPIIAIIAVIVAIVRHFKKEEENRKRVYYNLYAQPIQQTQVNYSVSIQSECPYYKRELLTQTEYNFYLTLKEECNKRNFLICPKVRMEDFLEVKPNFDKMKYRGYIKSRHIDFMICNQNMNILCGIELDDKSHYSQKAQEVDNFKNQVFRDVGIPLYRIVVGHGSYREQLEAAFYTMQQRNINM